MSVRGEVELERLSDEVRVALVCRYVQDMGPQAREQVQQMVRQLVLADRLRVARVKGWRR